MANIFHRCYYYGHVCAYNHSLPCDTEAENEARRCSVEETKQYILGLGYRLVHMRECAWRVKKTLCNLQAACNEMHQRFFPDTR